MTRQAYSQLSKELQEFLQREGVNLSANEIQLRKHVLKSLDEIVTKWGQRVYQSCRKQAGVPNVKEYNLVKMLPQGSYYLQTDDPTSDIDVIVVTSCCIRRRNHFFGHHSLALQTMLKQDERAAEVVAISSASVPLLRFRFYGIDIDMGMCQLQQAEITDHLDYSSEDLIRNWVVDEESRKTLGGWRSTIAIRDLWQGDPQSGLFRNYKLVVRLLKLWAKRRGLYSNVLGFFGGINISILVGRILQTNNVHTSPAEMVFKFFKAYDCEWGTTFGLFPFPGSQHVLEPSYSGNWQSHSMKIITPTLPQINSSSSVFPSSLTVIRQEIQRGKQICQQILDGSQTKTWSDLTEPIDFWNSYQYFLVLNISVSNKDHLAGWQGKVISKIRKLAIDLQHLVGLVRPWTFPVYKIQKNSDKSEIPPQDQCGKCVMYFLSLEKNPENINKAYFDNVIRNFRQSTISEYTDEFIYRNGMDITLQVVSRSELPADCFSECNNMEKINQQRLGDFEWKLRDAALNSIGGHHTGARGTNHYTPHSRKQRWPYDRTPNEVSWICQPVSNHDNIRKNTQGMAAAISMLNSQWLLNSLRSPVQSENQPSPLRSNSVGAPYTPTKQTITQKEISAQKGVLKEGANTTLTPWLFQGKDFMKQMQLIVNADKSNNHNQAWKQRASAKSLADLSKLLQENHFQIQKPSQQVPLRRSASEVNSTCSDSQLFKENIQQFPKRRQLTPALDGRRQYAPTATPHQHQQQYSHTQQMQDNWNTRQGIKIQVAGQNSIGCRLFEGDIQQLEVKRLSFSEQSFPMLQKQAPQNQQARPTSNQGDVSKLQGEEDKLCPLSYAEVVNKPGGAIICSSSMVTPSSTPDLGVFEESIIPHSPLWSADEQDNNALIQVCNSGISQSSEDVKIQFTHQFKQLDHFCLDENPAEVDKVKVQDLLSILNRNSSATETEDVFAAALSRSGSGSQYFSEAHTNLTEKENVVAITVSGGRRCSEESDGEQISHMSGLSSNKETNSKNIYHTETQEHSDESSSKQMLVGSCFDTQTLLRRNKMSKLEPISQQMEFVDIDELKQSILGSSFSATETQSTLQRNNSEFEDAQNARSVGYDSDFEHLLHRQSLRQNSVENEVQQQQKQVKMQNLLQLDTSQQLPTAKLQNTQQNFLQNLNVQKNVATVQNSQQNFLQNLNVQNNNVATNVQNSLQNLLKSEVQQQNSNAQESVALNLQQIFQKTEVQHQYPLEKQQQYSKEKQHDSMPQNSQQNQQQPEKKIENENEKILPKISTQNEDQKIFLEEDVGAERNKNDVEFSEFLAFIQNLDALPARPSRSRRNAPDQVAEVFEDDTQQQDATNVDEKQQSLVAQDNKNQCSQQEERTDSCEEIVTIPSQQLPTYSTSNLVATVPGKKYTTANTRGRRWRRERRSFRHEKRHARKTQNLEN